MPKSQDSCCNLFGSSIKTVAHTCSSICSCVPIDLVLGHATHASTSLAMKKEKGDRPLTSLSP